jgi:hypothetical protein
MRLPLEGEHDQGVLQMTLSSYGINNAQSRRRFGNEDQACCRHCLLPWLKECTDLEKHPLWCVIDLIIRTLQRIYQSQVRTYGRKVGAQNVSTKKLPYGSVALLSADNHNSRQQNHTLVASCLTCAPHEYGKDDITQRLSLPAVGAPFSPSSEAAAAFAFGLGAAFGFGAGLSESLGWLSAFFAAGLAAFGSSLDFFSAGRSALVRTLGN